MAELKVDEISESGSGADITFNNTITSIADVDMTITRDVSIGRDLTVGGTTTLSDDLALGANNITTVGAITTSGTVTAGAGVTLEGGLTCAANDITGAGALDCAGLTCTSLTIGSTLFGINLKAFGEIVIADTDTGDAPTVTTGDYNLGICAHNKTANLITVNFDTSMSGSNYIPLVWIMSDLSDEFRVISMSKSASNIQLTYHQSATVGGTVSTSSEAITIFLAILEI